jgi:HEAT repeat protein
VRVFAVQVDKDAYLDMLTPDERIARYWEDPLRAIAELIKALSHYHPLGEQRSTEVSRKVAVERYRELALESCDIIDLANLPEADRNIATRQIELRRLYVPLHVEVEPGGDVDSDRSAIEAIEHRRMSSRHAATGWGDVQYEKARSLNRIDVGSRLGNSRQLIILGDPGAGKTTMLRWIATAYLLRLNQDPDWKGLPGVSSLPNEDWLPVIIRCRDLDVTALTGTLEDILNFTLRKAEMSRREADEFRDHLREMMKLGQVLLLFDGLDEIAVASDRAQFCRQIEAIRMAFPAAPIVATSRVVGYREMGYRIGRGFEHVTVADLSDEDKDDFAKRWCALTEQPEKQLQAAHDLIHAIHSSSRIERLTDNPMLLTTMALVKRKIGRLPNRRVELYEQAMDVLLHWRNEFEDAIDEREALPQLEYLAYAMCHRGAQQLREDEVLDLLEQFRSEYQNLYAVRFHTSDQFLRLLESRTGIFVEAGYTRHLGRLVPVFEFRHLTFQEYLAGLALVQGHFPGRNRTKILGDYIAPLAGITQDSSGRSSAGERSGSMVVDSWREALRLTATLCNDDDVDDVLLAILTPQAGEAQTERARALLAMMCLADEPNASDRVASLVLREFSARLEVRSELEASLVSDVVSMDAAMQVSPTRWRDGLLHALLEEFGNREGSDRDSVGGTYASVYWRNATGLEDRIAGLSKLVEMLESDSEERIRAAALACWNPWEIHGDCHAELARMVDSFERWIDLGSPSTTYAVAKSLRLLVRDIDFVFDRVSQSARTKIYSHVGNGNFEDVTLAELLMLIADIGDSEDCSRWSLLTRHLEDERVVVKVAALGGLSEIRDKRSVSLLVGAVWDRYHRVRASAAYALGEICEYEAVGPLITALKDQNEGVRSSAALALCELQSPEAVESLLVALKDQNEGVRSSAARALGVLRAQEAVGPLITALKDQNEGVRSSAAQALGELRAVPEAVNPLMDAVLNADGDLRESAVTVLGKLQVSEAVGPLIAAMRDRDKRLRWKAADALGELRAREAVEPLIDALQDQDWWLRSSAAQALGVIGAPEAIEPLILALKDQDWIVRSNAVQALGELRALQAAEPLMSIIRDQDNGLRSSAARALGKIRIAEAIEPLVSALEGGDSELRFIVTESLGAYIKAQAVNPEHITAQKNDCQEEAIWHSEITNIQRVQEVLEEQADKDPDIAVRLMAIALLSRHGYAEHTMRLRMELSNPVKRYRIRACEALARSAINENEQLLLSEDLDGMRPFLDPARLLTRECMLHASHKLQIPIDRIHGTYLSMSTDYPFHFEDEKVLIP